MYTGIQGAKRQFYDSNLMQLHQIKTKQPVCSINMAFGTLVIASRFVITDVRPIHMGYFFACQKIQDGRFIQVTKRQSFDAITSNKDPNKFFQ